MSWLIPTLVILALIALNGLFVAAEFAIISAPRTAIERRAQDGEKSAQRVLAIIQDPLRQDRYIATAQLGITFASLALGMYGEQTLARGLASLLEPVSLPQWIGVHAIASVVAIGVLTYLHIVLGEMVPKSLALICAEQTVLWISQPMLWLKRLGYPLVVALNGLGIGVLRLMGIERRLTSGHYHSTEELEMIVEESEQSGVLDPEAGQILRDLLAFRERTLGEVMVPRVQVTGLPLGARPEEIAAVIRQSARTRYPVYEGSLDNIVGIIHIKELLRLLVSGRPISREDVHVTAFLPETARLDAALNAMRSARTHMVVVIDEYGGTAGIATIEDLGEEVVGEIGEDGEGSEALFDAEGRLYVAGDWRLDEVGEELGIELEHPEVDSIGGLVLLLLEREPQVGDSVRYAGLQITVLTVEGHAVGQCVVSREGEDDAPAPQAQ
ncbi:MAG: HlyC/CorC family transporter [Xanthomonadaceae bacterium]|nr:HlyC/CorC family transporter [Xanthomonadaceae bacterium]